MAGETNTDSSVEQTERQAVAPTETSPEHVSVAAAAAAELVEDLKDSLSNDVTKSEVQEETKEEVSTEDENVKQISVVEHSTTELQNDDNQEVSANEENASPEEFKVVEQIEPAVQKSESSVMEQTNDVSTANEEDNAEPLVTEKTSTEPEPNAPLNLLLQLKNSPLNLLLQLNKSPLNLLLQLNKCPLILLLPLNKSPLNLLLLPQSNLLLVLKIHLPSFPGQFKIEFDVGSNKGDGFVGQMFKAFLTEGERREVFLCKIPPLNEARRRQFPTMTIFSRETLAYKTLLPLMFSYQESKGVTREDGFFNVPKCYYAECDETAEESVIIMEDLRLQDYRMWDKMVPVNYEHVKLTMQSLGRLHAVSLALKRDRPEDFEQFKVPDPLQVIMPEGSPMAAMMVQMLNDAIETLEPHETKERNKMQKLAENMYKEMLACADSTTPEPYTVLGHGDCWVNNFMFNYKKGAPEHIVLLDWQISRYVSPVLDLVYFLFCCTDEEFRRRHYDEMINVYYNSFETLVEKLGHSSQEVFPRTALMRQLRRYGKFGILMAIFLVPMLCTRNEDLLDMDEAAEKYRDTNKMDLAGMTMNANKQAYRSRMSAVVRDIVRYGYL
uniref:CHK kinase-like domain-containing protein n=1 Tax=Anopheles maculatus TaxID=74869 RepID=A0A182T5A6_9DIPT